MIFRKLLLASSLLLAGLASAKKSDGPKITAKKFDSEPINLFYFEDTDTIMFQESGKGTVHRSTDAGDNWDVVKGPDGAMKGNVAGLMRHPHDNARAYAVGKEDTHWITEDAGKSWRSFTIDKPLSRTEPFVFHGKDFDKVLVQAEENFGFLRDTFSLYTTDGFKTVNPMLEGQKSCTWAIATPLFGDDIELDPGVEDRIFCVVPGLHSPLPADYRFLSSDNFFEDQTASEAPLSDGRAIMGVIRTAGVKKFLLAAATSDRSDELALYVTDDAVRWHLAEFGGHKIEEGAYTVLESTNYSVQVGVLSNAGPNPMGVLFTSNSNGTYYTRNTEHLNFDSSNTVDFEKVAAIQGIILVNTVDNWEQIENRRETEKKIVSQISFDDGRTFQPLKSGDKNLHLHSVTELTNSGRVFSSPAPGLVMGVGNTGDRLKEYGDGNLYVSDDAGLTWRKALDDAHKYEFGDKGSVLLAVHDEGRTEEVSYSINHGKDWKTAKLPHKIRAKQLTTTPDSTSLRFLLVGAKKGDQGEHQLISIDFSEMEERKCKEDDFERWPARLDENGEPDCLMGHKQFYRRRKADADCFIRDTEFNDPVPEFESCACTKEDFECDTNFIRGEDGESCVPAGRMWAPTDECQNSEDEYVGDSGFRLIPGNDCDRKGGVELDKEQVKRPCNDTAKAPATGEITVEKTPFDSYERQYIYLDRIERGVGDDETIIMLTENYKVFITKDHGKTWKQVLEGEDIREIIPHQYYNDVVYFITSTKTVYWTIDRGDTFHGFEAKLSPTRDKTASKLSFHPRHRDWLIWAGDDDCGDTDSLAYTAYYSTNRGEEWHLLRRCVKKCAFLGMEGRQADDKMVLCAQYEDENVKSKQVQLISTEDWFETSTVHFDDINNFATSAEFIVVAARADDGKSLKVDASLDGNIYADAQFPENFHIEAQQAYTVLPTTSHAVFLHVTVSSIEGHEYGSIIKSNSNGTSYVMSINGVNRNTPGFADFEIMEGLEGVQLVNVVANVEETDKGAPKRFKSKITHNDGAEWALLPPPRKDVDGNGFDCATKDDKAAEKCSLHLHGFTERKDYRDTYSSASAIGLMIGNGNVGEYLSPKNEADTFITRDGGISWQQIKKGSYMWEFGDQGSVIVIVSESEATKTLFYTLDEGDTWTEFEFSDVEMQIDDISTVPSDTSLNFLLWAKGSGSGSKNGVVTINVDFSGLNERERKCVLREDQPEADDYYLWEPKHPMQEDNCLFGHKSQYHRKRLDAQCYNGRETKDLDHIKEHCLCTRQDFECDYNYETQSDGSCDLVPGLSPADPKQVCRDDPDAVEYYKPTGYRRIPLSTCEGGTELDRLEALPCPDKEEEFEQKHGGLKGFALFLVVILPIGLAAAAGYYAFMRWDGKFGRIRLGEAGADGLLSRDSPLVSIPVTVVAGTVAVLSAIPLLATSLWRSASGYVRIPGRGGQRPYASRGAFAARRGDYTSVVDDEDELLGADEFEDDDEDEV